MSKTPRSDIFDLSGAAFQPLSVKTRLAMILFPLLGFGAITAGIAYAKGETEALFLLGMAAATFLGGGKLVVFAGAVDGAPLGTLALATLVVYCDMGTALIMIANMQSFYRIPLLGRRLAAMREAGYRVLDARKWIRRASWLGLAIFVAVPFQGTGAVVGVILGRIIGLGRAAILASIAVGSSAGVLALAAVGGNQQRQITEIARYPLLAAVVVGTCLVATFLLGRWFLRGRADTKGKEKE